MKILALETSGASAGVAAVEILETEIHVRAVAVLDEPRGLARDLIGALGELLEAVEWRGEELNLIAVGIGPGSWTSLRVGVTTAKTLAQVWQIPLAGVSSFDALAAAVFRFHESETEGLLLTALPCRPGEFYGKIFQVGEDFLAPLQAEHIASAAGLLDAAAAQALADEIDAPLLLAGEAASELALELEKRGENGEQLEISLADVTVEIALAGFGQWQSDEIGELFEILPLYLAPSNAERNLKL